MKKKHTLLAISIGTAIGLFIGVNADFEKTNLFRMMKEVKSCVDQGLTCLLYTSPSPRDS